MLWKLTCHQKEGLGEVEPFEGCNIKSYISACVLERQNEWKNVCVPAIYNIFDIFGCDLEKDFWAN